MKHLTSLFIAIIAILAMTSCKTTKQADDSARPAKTLVLYYSQTGTTKAVAEQLADALGADIEAIELVQPYDGSYDQTIARCIAERQDNIVPEIKPLNVDISDYDVVFLGYPIWFGTYARPIHGLIEVCDFEGKKVVPFCTFGSGGLEASAADLAQALPKAEVGEGYGVRNARIDAVPDELNYFLVTNGYIEGEVESLPEYSEQQPVTEDEVAIFDAACGDYQFPLGTPATVGKRTTANSTDYQYTVNSKGMDGSDVQTVIYVTVPNGADATPVFTRVVR